MKGFGLRAYAIAYLIFLYAPIVLLPIFAFNSGTIIAFPLQSFTTEWFVALAGKSALHDAVGNSLYIAVLTAVLSTLLGICTARAGVGGKFRGKGAIIGFIMLPLVLPEIIVAVSLLVMLRQVLEVSLSNWTVIAAHVLICTPFCVAILNGAFSNLDPAMEEAAMDLGETRWSAFRLITLPLVAPGIISSMLIAFTISLDEFIIAFFLTGSNPTMPVYIWGLLRFPSQLPVVMALGTLLVGLSILLLSIAEYFRRRGVARAGLKDTGGFL
ncbi:MAG: ABC transporter permease [Rhodobacteraceae bacterium]|nr:ABC transporter permease [Paracoccaceae bacterium]